MDKMIIYQVFPRWFGNLKSPLAKNGSVRENGVKVKKKEVRQN